MCGLDAGAEPAGSTKSAGTTAARRDLTLRKEAGVVAHMPPVSSNLDGAESGSTDATEIRTRSEMARAGATHAAKHVNANDNEVVAELRLAA
jgi:hypothetical protein